MSRPPSWTVHDHEIGGNCVEVESQGKRIVLDIGLPLKDDKSVGVPDISGLMQPDESLLGIGC